MIKLTNDEIQALIESIGGNMNHIGELDGRIVPMNNHVGLLHCIDDLMLINQQRDRIAELEREKAELVAQVETVKSAYRNLCGAIGDMDDTEHDSVEQAEAIGVVFEKMREGWQIVNTAAHECLNQIKAEAVQEFLHILEHAPSSPVSAMTALGISQWWPKFQAASIAKGE